MENQEINQPIPPVQSVEESGNNKGAVAMIAVVLVIIIAGVAWYYSRPNGAMDDADKSAMTGEAVTNSTDIPPLSDGTTATDIESDLNNLPDVGGAINQDQNSLGSSIESL